MVDAVQQGKLAPFTTIKYVTKDGENCTATKNNGVVTVVGDKTGTRQLPLDKFMAEFVETLPKVNLENTPKADTVAFSGNPEDDIENASASKNISKGAVAALAAVGTALLASGVYLLTKGKAKKVPSSMDGIIKKSDGVWHELKKSTAETVDKAKETIKPTVEEFETKFAETAEQVKEKLQPAVDKAKENLKPTVDKAEAGLKETINQAKEKIQPVVEKAKETLKPAVEKIETKVTETAAQAKEKVKPVIEKTQEKAGELTDKAKTTFTDIMGEIFSGKNLTEPASKPAQKVSTTKPGKVKTKTAPAASKKKASAAKPDAKAKPESKPVKTPENPKEPVKNEQVLQDDIQKSIEKQQKQAQNQFVESQNKALQDQIDNDNLIIGAMLLDDAAKGSKQITSAVEDLAQNTKNSLKDIADDAADIADDFLSHKPADNPFEVKTGFVDALKPADDIANGADDLLAHNPLDNPFEVKSDFVDYLKPVDDGLDGLADSFGNHFGNDFGTHFGEDFGTHFGEDFASHLDDTLGDAGDFLGGFFG